MFPQKIFDQLLIFVNLYQHAKNQFIPSVYPSDRVSFSVLWPDWPHPFLIMSTPKIFNYPLICMNLYQHAKDQLIFIFEIQSILESKKPIGQTHILAMPNQKIFRTFNYCEFISVCKKWGCFIDSLWLAEHFGLYLRFSPNIGFVQEHGEKYTFSLSNKSSENW